MGSSCVSSATLLASSIVASALEGVGVEVRWWYGRGNSADYRGPRVLQRLEGVGAEAYRYRWYRRASVASTQAAPVRVVAAREGGGAAMAVGESNLLCAAADTT